MKRKRRLLHKIFKALELPEDLDPQVPRLTVIGNGQMLLENAAGIRSYTRERAVLLTGSGPLFVTGSDLVLREMAGFRVLITGILQSWGFEDSN